MFHSSCLIRRLFQNVRNNLLNQVSASSSNSAAIRAQELLDETYTSIRSQRFEDIIVIQTHFNASPRYIILASAFNHRHLVNGTDMVNKLYKQTIKTAEEDFAQLSISPDWNVLDFRSVIVHLFSRECRDHFDIEQLWTCGEKYDDLTNFPELYDPLTSGSTFLSLSSIPGASAGTATGSSDGGSGRG